MTEVLGTSDAIAFWDERHRKQGELLSGGDLSFDHASNEIFYALRVGRLIDAIGVSSSTVAPRRLLDAGCGKGVFSRAMATFGHRVDGIDSSPHAIDLCTAAARARETYYVSTLDQWAPPYLYDVVYCVDVVFHIMDDEVWERSVANLASLVRLGGQLLIADHEGDEDRVWSNYQKTRAASSYERIAGRLGHRRQGFSPYRFRESPAGFHSFVREG